MSSRADHLESSKNGFMMVIEILFIFHSFHLYHLKRNGYRCAFLNMSYKTRTQVISMRTLVLVVQNVT